MSTSTPAVPRARGIGKPIVWILVALASISVLIFTEYPLITTVDAYHNKLIADRLLLAPHAIAGVLATLLGPFLFSTRFRQRHLKRHRIMGRVYVGCIAIAAPIAFYLELNVGPLPAFANGVMATLWFLCMLAAFLTARNRQLVAHRQWMIRSYLFTLNFIFTRVPNPIPAYFKMSDAAFALSLLFFSVLYLFFADVYFNWRELTHSRG
jgi:uncharacterized membrane protein